MSDETKNWSTEQTKFQLWLALPKKLRRPKTQGELANLLGANEATLSDWKKLDGFQEEVNKWIKAFTVDDVADVVAAVASKAKKGSKGHAELFLELAGIWRRGLDVTTGGKQLPAIPITNIQAVRPPDADPDQQ